MKNRKYNKTLKKMGKLNAKEQEVIATSITFASKLVYSMVQLSKALRKLKEQQEKSKPMPKFPKGGLSFDSIVFDEATHMNPIKFRESLKRINFNTVDNHKS